MENQPEALEPTEAGGSSQQAEAGEPSGDGDDGHQIILSLTDDAFQKLKGTADRTSLSVADLVKNGLAIAEWLEEESSRGGKVLVKRGDQLSEVNLPGSGSGKR